LQKAFTLRVETSLAEVNKLDIELKVDGEDIPLNDFVRKMLSGTFAGAVTSLRDIKRDWKEIRIRLTQ
jgi:hypothetical protein